MSETDRAEREEFRAYYFSLFATGCEPIDNILRWIARAGEAFHSTSQWDDQKDGASYVDLIQEAADQAAAALAAPAAPEAPQPVAWKLESAPEPDCGDEWVHSGFTMDRQVVAIYERNGDRALPLYLRPPARQPGADAALLAEYEDTERRAARAEAVLSDEERQLLHGAFPESLD